MLISGETRTVSAISLNQSVLMYDIRSVEEGMAVLGRIETAWNWVLADRHGNIGYQMSGLMPKRRERVSGFVPLPGWDPVNDWQGFEQPEDLPRSYNPECGYFVTSNQDLNAYGRVNPINAGVGLDVIDDIDSNTGIFNDFYIYFDQILLSEMSVWFGGRSREDLYRQALAIALKSPPEKWGEGRRVVMKNIVFGGKLPRFLGFDRGRSRLPAAWQHRIRGRCSL